MFFEKILRNLVKTPCSDCSMGRGGNAGVRSSQRAQQASTRLRILRCSGPLPGQSKLLAGARASGGDLKAWNALKRRPSRQARRPKPLWETEAAPFVPVSMRFSDFVPCSSPLKTLILLTFLCFLIRGRGRDAPFPAVSWRSICHKKLCANPQRHASGKSFCACEMQKIYRKGFSCILRGIFSFCAGKVA